jgi:LysM repeat protein
VIPDPSVVTPSSQPPSGGVTDYVVKQGDTLLRIAFAHQTTVANLMSLNSITDASRIFVGQKLRVQPGSSKPLEPLVVKTAPGTVDYVVKRGDTLQKIARANKTTVAALTSLNSLSRPNRLLVGQKLKIPTKNSQTQSFHRVQAKDTLPIIAERRGTPIANLIRLNPGVAATGDLRDGTLIRIS